MTSSNSDIGKLIRPQTERKCQYFLFICFVCILFTIANACSSKTSRFALIGKTYHHEEPGKNCFISIIFYDDSTCYINEQLDCSDILDYLVELCENTKCKWEMNGDTIFITSLFQNRVDDFIYELNEDVSEDSVSLVVFSLQTGKPIANFEVLLDNDVLLCTDSSGKITFPESETRAPESVISSFINRYNEETPIPVHLLGGKCYRANIEYCWMSVINQEKYYLIDSNRIRDTYGRVYHILTQRE